MTAAGATAAQLRRAFWIAAGLLLAVRLGFSAAMPITGDEAYFYYWGLVPAGGFYDHPPMIGWWLAALLEVGDAEWLIRLPSTLLPLLAAAVAHRLVLAGSPPGDADAASRAWSAALLAILAPVNVWNVFITTDTPLIAFSLLSALAYLAALGREGRPALLLHALAGLCLGLALLSKYFAVFLGFAYVVHALLLRRDRGRVAAIVVLAFAALPGLLFNLWWNSGSCWSNVLFNFYNRHEGSGLGWQTPPLYALTLAYVLSPFALFAAWRHRAAVTAALLRRGPAATLLWLALIPFALFALLSPVKTIGLHWLLSFVPLALTGLVLALPLAALPPLLRWFGGFALLHVVLIAVLLALPLSTWHGSRVEHGLVLTFRSAELLARLQPLEKDYVFASDGYSNAVTLGYNARRYFFVFGPGSSHARHDDILTDLRALDGRNIAILRKTPAAPGEYEPYFARVTHESFEVAGASFQLVRGEGFAYAPYRDRILTSIRDRWYRIPAFLPVSACYFCDRYFPGEPYPRR